VTIFPLKIPYRHNVEHDQEIRSWSEPVIVKVELSNGTVGFGETLPCAGVTGETVASVIGQLRGPLLDAVLSFNADSFSEALGLMEGLPWTDADGQPMATARAAVELALLDACMKRFKRSIDDLARWLGIVYLGSPSTKSPGNRDTVRFSGVLTSMDIQKTLRQLRRMYWRGLRHFKLKVGDEADDHRLRAVLRYLRKPIARGKATLRIDADGAWRKDDAIDRLGDWNDLPIVAVEQPLARGQEADLPVLHDLFDVTMIHDESLATMADGQKLVKLGVADAFSIGISKCGGFLPSLRLAGFAHRVGTQIQLGYTMGQTSILSAAGLRFLEVCPAVRWVEGVLGSLLPAGDVVRRPLHFGYGGRWPKMGSVGLGIAVDEAKLEQHCQDAPVVLNLG